MGITRKAPIFKIRSNTGITINSINPTTIRALNPVMKSAINSKYGFFSYDLVHKFRTILNPQLYGFLAFFHHPL
jgi:hypothetical protein